jgi:hypothetical protein
MGLRGDLHDRTDEAYAHGWLGDIEELTIGLAAANDKLDDLDRLTTRKTTVHPQHLRHACALTTTTGPGSTSTVKSKSNGMRSVAELLAWSELTGARITQRPRCFEHIGPDLAVAHPGPPPLPERRGSVPETVVRILTQVGSQPSAS